MAKKQSYEEMIIELEGIVRLMEGEQLSLDESLKNYEKGIKLYSKLYTLLNEAEGKIKIVKENAEEDFLCKRE